MKISVVSGGFDPIHSGHISYLKDAKSYGEILIVALNSDKWLINKKGQNFLSFNERRIILESLEFVDEVIDFDDDERGSCINALKDLKRRYPSDEIIFCFTLSFGGSFLNQLAKSLISRLTNSLIFLSSILK